MCHIQFHLPLESALSKFVTSTNRVVVANGAGGGNGGGNGGSAVGGEGGGGGGGFSSDDVGTHLDGYHCGWLDPS